MTLSETASYLNLHSETVRRLANKGDLKRYGTRQNQRFRRDELDDYLKLHAPWRLHKP